jgi:RNA polymerase sigma factor (sigma-70 family)
MSEVRMRRSTARAALVWRPGLPRSRVWDHGSMMVPGSPSPLELRRRSEDELLALVVAGRLSEDDRGREAARRAWSELVERDIDRVRALVRTWRLAGREIRVDAQDRDDATQHAFYRLLKMLGNFRGKVMPQYRAAMVTCVDWACREFCRREMRREMGLGGSLDDRFTGEDGEGAGRFDPVIGEMSEWERDDQEAGRLAIDALARGIDALPNENMKSVLRLTMEGYPSREIADRLELSVANVDQLRSRALRRLSSEMSEHVDA